MDPGELKLIDLFNARLLKRIVTEAMRMSQARQTDPDGPLLDVTKEDYEAAAEKFADHLATLVPMVGELKKLTAPVVVAPVTDPDPLPDHNN